MEDYMDMNQIRAMMKKKYYDQYGFPLSDNEITVLLDTIRVAIDNEKNQ